MSESFRVAWLPLFAAMSSEGDGTIVSQTNPTLTLTNTLDQFGRLAEVNWIAGTTPLDDYSYTYDSAGNVAGRVNGLHSALSETYLYDGLNQLTDTYRVGISTPYQGWTLDQQGNWTQFVNGTATQTRTADAANEITGITDTTDPNNPVAQAGGLAGE